MIDRDFHCFQKNQTFIHWLVFKAIHNTVMKYTLQYLTFIRDLNYTQWTISNFEYYQRVTSYCGKIKAYSAVLPYLLPLPLFMEFRGRGGWPKKFRVGWKSALLINYNESFKHKLIMNQFEVDYEWKIVLKMIKNSIFCLPYNFQASLPYP